MGVLIIYDGDCGFCNRFIRFIAENDSLDKCRFMSNTCSQSISLLKENSIDTSVLKKTIVVFDGKHSYMKSAAIVKIFQNIPKYKIVHLSLRIGNTLFLDFCYSIVSLIRRRFPNKKNCTIPNSNIKQKFIC